MNERLVLVSANRILNENMMMHDQSKVFANEFYHGEGRYGLDDGMIDELMINGSDSLADLSHLENTLNKTANLSANMMPLSSEDYFNQFTYNQVTNMMMNNTNQNQNHLSNSNQYTYHTLQSPQIQNNQNYNNQLMQSNSNVNSYMSLAPQSNTYGSKIMTRTPSFNSSLCGSSSSSSSPLSLSTSSLNNIQASNQNAVSSSTNDSFDYDNASSSGTPSTPANDPAELVRQKQMRGITLTQEELQLLAKDRQRKDNHNMIERRRRFNINDRIKELGQLLPKNGEYDAKQNKGSILKASVDYILKIKSDNDETIKIQETNKYLISLNKKLYNRIKDLEMLCRSNGIPLLNQVNNSNSGNYLIFNNKTDIQQQNDNSLKENSHSLNDNFTTSFSTFNQNELVEHSCKLDDSQTILNSDNNLRRDNCNLPSILIYNENAPQYQTDATNFNQTNQAMTTTTAPATVKKAKNESKKRAFSNSTESSEFNTKINQQKINKEVKKLKEEPISPKTNLTLPIASKPLQQTLNYPNEIHVNQEQFEQNENQLMNSSIKYPKIQQFPNQRFIITAKLINRVNQPDAKVIYESEQKDSTLTSSKDPTLASSSISSPSSPSTSSPSSSSNSSSLCQN